jgi:hypothetical protein
MRQSSPSACASCKPSAESSSSTMDPMQLDLHPSAMSTQPPSFRQRKSTTIIPISQTPSPSVSPPQPITSLPDLFDPPHSHPDPTAPPSFKPVTALRSHNPLERRISSDSSAAEEGESTPLLPLEGHIGGNTKWYEGPLFVTGVKLGVLFFIFTGIVVGTFWFGMPPLEP